MHNLVLLFKNVFFFFSSFFYISSFLTHISHLSLQSWISFFYLQKLSNRIAFSVTEACDAGRYLQHILRSSEVHLKILLNDLKYCCKMLGVGTEFFEVVYACQSF